MNRNSGAVVFGSLNLDYVIRVNRVPGAGETVDGSALSFSSGGKGGNQAVALARAGACTTMIGCVGEDAAGEKLLAALNDSGVDVALVRRVPEVPSGSAFIVVDEAGENRIIVVPGANGAVGFPELASLEASLSTARVLLLQFEIPLEAVVLAARAARAANATVILDPAPARSLPSELQGLIDILTPNESEASVLTGQSINDDRAAAKCAATLRAQAKAQTVIVKRAGKGIVVDSGMGARIIPAPKVEVTDTTAAGDAFNGALGAAICKGFSLNEAIAVAISAGALSVTKTGGQSSIPNRTEIERFMARPLRPAQ